MCSSKKRNHIWISRLVICLAIVPALVLIPSSLAQADVSGYPDYGPLPPGPTVSGSLGSYEVDQWPFALISNNVNLMITGDYTSLDLGLKDSTGTVIDSTGGSAPSVSINYSLLAPGTYHLFIENLHATPVDYTFNYMALASATIYVNATVEEYLPELTFTIAGGTAPTGGAVSATSIDFGTLLPSTPKTGSHMLSVTTNSSSGYMVLAAKYGSMHLSGSPTAIPDVTGDDGTITDEVAGPWVEDDTYGFGYTLSDSVGTDAAFTSGYKQFADRATPREIMANTGPVTSNEVEIGYKVNIPITQAAGDYSCSLWYLCTVNF